MNPWAQRLIAMLVVVGVFVGIFWFSNYIMAPARTSGAPVKVDIPYGASAGTIAKRLKEAGAIRNATAFTLMARILGESQNMKAGEYNIPSNLGVVEIIDRLVAGEAEMQWVLIPEGKTLAQVASVLSGQRLAKQNEFLRAARRRPKSFGLEIPVSRRSVEGYLMPDTYKFPKRASEQALIKEMLENWYKKVYLPNEELFKNSTLPLDKVMIIASLIEREARVPQDRELISSVIRNRLKNKMPLQVDATVLYALGRHKNVVTFADLKVDSEYNTYKNVGLPPGPICSPGAAAIKAALQPAKTDYLYYVAKPDGSHIFTRNYAEHQAAVAKARKMKAGA